MDFKLISAEISAEDNDVTAKIYTNGAFVSENAKICLAVYKNSRLYKVNYLDDTLCAGEILSLDVLGVEYSETDDVKVKVFVWDDAQFGSVFEW